MTNKIKIFGLFICAQSAVHVSGDVFAQHQEHVTVFIVNLCYRQFHLIQVSGRQHRRCIIPQAVNTV